MNDRDKRMKYNVQKIHDRMDQEKNQKKLLFKIQIVAVIIFAIGIIIGIWRAI